MPSAGERQRKRRKSLKPTSAVEGVLEELRNLCLSLPEATERESFGHPNFLAGKKTFVTFEEFGGTPSIAFRLGSPDIERLSAEPLFFPTPYGRGQWLSLRVDGTFDWTLVERLVVTSYRGVALRRMLVQLDRESGME